MTARFRFLPACNDSALAPFTGSTDRLAPRHVEMFDDGSMPAKVAQAIAATRSISIKEFFESTEFFARVRRRLRARVVADLCCGHGLTGLLFAVFEPRVERIVLVDKRRPPSHDRLHDALVELAPWIEPKLDFRTTSMNGIRDHLPERAAILAVHACGPRSDTVIDIAHRVGGAVGVLPCCDSRRAYSGSPAIERALGIRDACDIERTLRLEAAGYRVTWDELPSAITPMRRLLVATPPVHQRVGL